MDRGKALMNIRQIESIGLMESSLRIKPWSDNFWPDLQGSIAWDYANGRNNISVVLSSWNNSRGRIVGRAGPRANMQTITEAEIDSMSPAEKYDMLLGDDRWTLTNSVIASVDKLSNENMTARWSGVCHGWSPASLSMPRPLHYFRVKTPFGRDLTFYPADVRALESYLWANSQAGGDVHLEGEQCYSGAEKNKNGRLVDSSCADVNPGFFHLTMVNRVGVQQQGFVMDRNYKGEVQNQPVFAYRTKFFSLKDRHPRPGMSLDAAKVYYGAHFFDPYKNYRSPEAVSVVGVEAQVFYRKGIDPTHATTNDESTDKYDVLTIRYDLELDSNDNVIGGEWHEFDDAAAQSLAEAMAYQHPDILWLPQAGLQPYNFYEGDVAGVNWSANMGSVPPILLETARKAAKHENNETFKGRRLTIPRPQILKKVVDSLFELSRK
jgi:hypothetical protein